MTDRELLELAAKAAGIKALRAPDGVLRDCTGDDPMMNIFASKPWNPLTNDGDALRLAVKLRLDIGFEKLHTVSVWSDPQDGWIIEHCDDGMGADISEKTRRAIVRAAAEIGRSMK